MSEMKDPVAATTSGTIKGEVRAGLYVFKGIPYAAPPLGEWRWRPPRPVEPWTGTRLATSFGNAAPQVDTGPGLTPDLDVTEPRNEDCLYLNVWTPGLDDAARPVLVWIHGGAFSMGSGALPMFNGAALARRGNAVVVTINYRLGFLGFLRLNEVTGGEIPATGNEGLLDQVTALQWVRDNIADFGGDPQNVTVFGESAGAMSIGCLLAMPAARGLFSKAVLQSGAGHTVTGAGEASSIAARFLDVLGAASNGRALLAMPAERLLDAGNELATLIAGEGTRPRLTLCLPVIDGDVLPVRPVEAVRGGSAQNIPLLVGTNLEEWRLMGMMDPGLPGLDQAGLLERCRDYMPADRVAGLVETYRDARTERGADTGPAELFRAIQTDQMFRIPALRLIEAQQPYAPVYNYLFTWASPVMDGVLGACHMVEVGFVFGTHNETLCGSGPDADGLAARMQDIWLGFAGDGNPGVEGVGSWPPYGRERITMLLGKDCYPRQAVYDEERRAWDAVPDELIGQI